VTNGTATLGLDNPVGAAFGPDGNLYIGEANSNEIDEINVDGNGTTASDVLNKYITISGTNGAWGIAFTPEPASLSLLSLAAGTLLLRRRRSAVAYR
jgi:hypothetical protein